MTQDETFAAPELAPAADPPLIGQTPIAHSPTVAALFAAFAAAQADFPAKVEAEQTGWVGRIEDGREYKYSDLGSVLEPLRAPLGANGLSIACLPTPDINAFGAPVGVSMTFLLAHASGEWLSVTFSLGADLGKPQAVGSVMTYLQRYLTTKVLMVAADKDDDGAAVTAAANAPRGRRAPVGGYDPDRDDRPRATRAAPKPAAPPPPPAGTVPEIPLPEGDWTKALWSEFYTIARGRLKLSDAEIAARLGDKWASRAPAELFAYLREVAAK